MTLRGIGSWGRYSDWGPLATHIRFVERSCRKLARSSFHGMAIYQAKMERKQGFLFRCVDIVMELFVMTATLSHARRLRDDGQASGAQAIQLADLFCRGARRKVQMLFRSLWSNEDARRNHVVASVMKGQHLWLQEGRMDLGFTAESFKTRAFTDRGGTAASSKPEIAAAS